MFPAARVGRRNARRRESSRSERACIVIRYVSISHARRRREGPNFAKITRPLLRPLYLLGRYFTSGLPLPLYRPRAKARIYIEILFKFIAPESARAICAAYKLRYIATRGRARARALFYF